MEVRIFLCCHLYWSFFLINLSFSLLPFLPFLPFCLHLYLLTTSTSMPSLLHTISFSHLLHILKHTYNRFSRCVLYNWNMTRSLVSNPFHNVLLWLTKGRIQRMELNSVSSILHTTIVNIFSSYSRLIASSCLQHNFNDSTLHCIVSTAFQNILHQPQNIRCFRKRTHNEAHSNQPLSGFAKPNCRRRLYVRSQTVNKDANSKIL